MKNLSKILCFSLFFSVLFACNTHPARGQTTVFTIVGTGSTPAKHTGADTTYFKTTISSYGTTNFHLVAVPTGTSPTDTGTIVWFASSDGVTYFAHPDNTNFASTSFAGAGTAGPSATGTTYPKSFNYSWINFASANSFKYVMARVISTSVGGTGSPGWTWAAYQTIRRGPGY